jgi:hypothetical protein
MTFPSYEYTEAQTGPTRREDLIRRAEIAAELAEIGMQHIEERGQEMRELAALNARVNQINAYATLSLALSKLAES